MNKYEANRRLTVRYPTLKFENKCYKRGILNSSAVYYFHSDKLLLETMQNVDIINSLLSNHVNLAHVSYYSLRSGFS